ncbi:MULTISPECIES: aspartate ammonia-lyase [Empedobacter]|uniref:Aspartate ammonia-lyase n=4 Tax=Empedobacter TaxID=59734 RepID=A0A3R8SRC7_9FLAO|nr:MULTISPECIES: aspartate ammonia-lyase [Empedobacter]HBX62366.1 aspartate ammonia-lyase [Flavobacteriaceae bacterium]MDH0659012.1 aspartate ammonia-lyase [Empedobacter sp. GD03865]MDH0675589.1 aspartate ammonia-lyase [Empedobacter sp. GD03861]MDH1602725.1 aspartate ammonia-lyase [Empedobacter sp. GD03739]MDM1139148.1 aspartate ammonia-lyase [Empedobacter sp. R132-2]
MNKMRTESDLLGELQIPETAYYGVQTQRAINNFKISNNYLSHYPEFVKALGVVKLGAAQANHELGILSKELFDAISFASNELIAGKYTEQFPIDMIQGGAGTSTNMNANEVIANIALEYLGKQKGEYQFCSPNDHVNLSQSTNDAYPSALKLALFNMNKPLVEALTSLYEALDKKGKQFGNVIKMGRTQLQDAVPMTLGQEFEGFSNTLHKEVDNLNRIAAELLVINMGATAIGTGLNAVPGYAQLCTTKIAEIMNEDVSLADNLVEATSDTSSFVDYSSALKRLCVKLSKICNDLRLLTSGPRTGLFEINLPPKQPGSSIMPGKVNPVIPEVVNQVCFKVIGNDLSITMAAEAGQLQLNVMEPIIGFSIMESIQYLTNAMNTLRVECVDGITANAEHLKNEVQNSIGIVTALNPYIGYKASTKIAKEALETGGGVYQLVLDHGLLSKERLDEILDPKNMLGPHI